MVSSWLLRSAAVVGAMLAAQGRGWAAPETQDIRIEHKLQIPEAVLEPGKYTFSVEDRLRDRAILRITAVGSDQRYFVLTTPSNNLPGAAADGLLFFQNDVIGGRILRGWACPGCSIPLEVAYPKAEAVKITQKSGQPVLAVDPEYDKLPKSLSADDMKVVTLWLLSPKRITAAGHAQGVTAKKYASVENDLQKDTREMARTQELARTVGMPKTASNTSELALWGILLTIAGLALTLARRGTA
jgi:hypothetical protein